MSDQLEHTFPAAILCATLALFLTGCQPTVYLMPTPEAVRSGEVNPFAETPEEERSNRVLVVYATNRLPLGLRSDRTYTTLYDDSLRLGVASLRIGGEESVWEDLYYVSTTGEREQEIPLVLDQAAEIAYVDADTDPDRLPPAAQEMFRRLNDFLAASPDKNLTVYVHGANNNFYRSTAQAAQYRHFTGRHSAVLAFSWPSAESLLRYAVDVTNARASVPVFARLLELLALHTDARYINILAYSAGAQVVSPGLAELARAYQDEDLVQVRRWLRLGEVYFAAPDVDFRAFVEHLASYIDLVQNVTLSVNVNDTVLALAASHHGVSRAGRPNADELSAEEAQWLIAEMQRPTFDVVKVTPEVIPQLSGGAHDFWYANPWVSTDVLIQMLFHARPPARGLVTLDVGADEDVQIWGFPPDYPQRAVDAVRQLRKASSPE